MLTRTLRHLSVVAVAAILALACLFPTSLRAQNISSAELHGTVHDASGAVIPNATVTIVDASKGFTRTTTSDGQGEYQLLLLPPGTYVLTVTSPGFAKLTESNVVLTVGERAELRLSLAVGGSETVNVSAGADIIAEDLEAAFAGKQDARSALDDAAKRGTSLLRQFERNTQQ